MTKYKVTGETAFLEHQPGEEFEAELTPEQERRALERGSIARAGSTKGKQAAAKEKEERNG